MMSGREFCRKGRFLGDKPRKHYFTDKFGILQNSLDYGRNRLRMLHLLHVVIKIYRHIMKYDVRERVLQKGVVFLRDKSRKLYLTDKFGILQNILDFGRNRLPRLHLLLRISKIYRYIIKYAVR